MFSNTLRILIIIVSMIIGIGLFLAGAFIGALIFIGAGILLLYGYFAYSTVWAAFKSIQSNDKERAKKLILSIKKPERLSKSQKGYYYFIQGYIKMSEDDFSGSMDNMEKAIKIGLRTSNDMCISALIIAESLYKLEKYNEAKENIEKAKLFSHKEALDEKIIALEQKVKEKTK